MARHDPLRDPDEVVRLASSFITRVNGALVIVLSVDVALVVLLADGTLRGDLDEPVLPAVIVPVLLLATSLVQATLGLAPRRHDAGVTASQGATPAAARAEAQRFARKWGALKRAALLTLCALICRFIALRLF